MLDQIKVIGFDADDTLWENENFFRDTEEKFKELLLPFTDNEIIDELFKTEIGNLNNYGYGIKSFVLSMIETAIHISDSKVDNVTLLKVIELGKEMINKPVVLIDGIKDVLQFLQPNYKLIVATKGDLKDQERKLEKSSLSNYFHHIEVMTDKTELQYEKLLKHLEIEAHEFLMIGNSMKSDILPVLNLGGSGIHIPYYTTWIHEEIDELPAENEKFFQFKVISDIKQLFLS